MTSGLFSMAVASGRTHNEERECAMGLENLLIWLQNHAATLIAIVAASVAAISAYIGRRETQKQKTLQAENLRHTVDAQSLAWGNACIDALNRAAMFARTRQHQANDAGFFQQRVNMMMAIQSLRQRGRLLFPVTNASGEAPILVSIHLAALEIEALTRQGGPTAANSAEFIDECRDFVIAELHSLIDLNRQAVLTARMDTRPALQRNAAHERANALKEKLKSRRPGLNLSDRKETVQ